jgi:crotonobetainyl-CoA:carnitine CoA-transferase CaiB-like acyl-CoA transferase
LLWVLKSHARLTIAQDTDDPQLRGRNMICILNDDAGKSVYVVGPPITLSEFPDPCERPFPPQLDQHRAGILPGL